MTRERWFWAQARRRRGPVLLTELVECILGQPDPRAVLVWRKGFAEWTRAEDVPDVKRRLAPVVSRREADGPAARREGAPASAVAGPEASVPAPPPAGSNAAVYGGIAAGLVVLGLLAWLFWPRAQPPQALPLGGSSEENAPAVVVPAGSRPAAAPSVAASGAPSPAPAAASVPPAGSPSGAASATVAAKETELPGDELRKLRGVAAWAGDKLRVTVYNSTAWRVTEVQVRIARFDGTDLVEDPRPLRLLPPAGPVDEGVADLLTKVAPDRRKPGLNALDTGPFEGKAGPRPENFRWEIESARGYAPR